MGASIDSHIFETSTPGFTANVATRLVELRDSTSSVMLALPSDASVHHETEARSSTFLLSRSLAYTVHRTMNLVLASGSSGFTKNVACTSTHLRSIVFAPMASFISNTSPM